MLKIAFLFTLLTVVYLCLSASTGDRMKDDNIKFVDTNDETEPIREKIRTEMDEYKRMKQLSLKSKKNSTKATTEAATTTTTEATSSSTVRQVYLGLDEEETNEAEDTTDTTDSTDGYETTTLEDRNIINAPHVCKGTQKYITGRCRDLL